jgi:hypothetical protein
MSQEKNLKRVETGRRSTLLVKIGIPLVYHGAKALPDVAERLEKFLFRDVESFDSVLLLTGTTSEDSYRAGAILAEMAVDNKTSVSVVGFRALLNVYKSSFRDPEARQLLHDKFGYSDILIFANVNERNYSAWGDMRDVTWFRGIVQQRASMKKKTVFCLEERFSLKQLRGLLGPDNSAKLLCRGNVTCVVLGEKSNGED